MTIEGTIKLITPVEQITPTFSKRECVIVTDEMYPQTIAVQFAQSRAALLDTFSEGQRVCIAINLQGREWKNPKTGEIQYFTSVSGWKIDPATGNAQQPNTVPAQGRPAAPLQGPVNPFNPSQAAPIHPQEPDDLPF